MSENSTAQEIFDTVLEGLYKQGVQSTIISPAHSLPQCKLRGDNGTKCSVGFLIPDEKYDPLLEKIDFHFMPPIIKYKPHHILIGALMTLHDEDKNWQRIKSVHSHSFSREGINFIMAIAAQHSLILPTSVK